MKMLAIALASAATLLLNTSVNAGLMHDSVPSSEYHALGTSEEFDSVGVLGSASGILIAGPTGRAEWVIAAEHVVVDSAGQLSNVSKFFLTDSAYDLGAGIGVSETFPHPVPDNFDLAILKLESPVTEVAPAVFYEGDLQYGDLIYQVGFGTPARPSTGYLPNDGLKRGATNQVTFTTVSDTYAQTDYVPLDLPALPFFLPPLPLGGGGTRGDSGGAWFIEVDGQMQLAGVISYGGGSANYSTTGAVKIKSALPWIQSIIGTAAPEPGSFILLIGGVGLICTAIRRSRLR